MVWQVHWPDLFEAAGRGALDAGCAGCIYVYDNEDSPWIIFDLVHVVCGQIGLHGMITSILNELHRHETVAKAGRLSGTMGEAVIADLLHSQIYR